MNVYTLVRGRDLYFFASATARARMARFFSSTLMGLTATAGAIGAPGPAPPINTLFVDVVMTRDSRRSLSSLWISADFFCERRLFSATSFYTGQEKPTFVRDNWERFAPWHNKLELITLDDLHDPQVQDMKPRMRERHARNVALARVKELRLSASSITWIAAKDY